jgi:hypothetical protein
MANSSREFLSTVRTHCRADRNTQKRTNKYELGARADWCDLCVKRHAGIGRLTEYSDTERGQPRSRPDWAGKLQVTGPKSTEVGSFPAGLIYAGGIQHVTTSAPWRTRSRVA